MGTYNNNLSQVVLVDANDHPTGVIEKMEAHRQGLLHRAVSVFLFNHHGDWLLQRRTAFKYHSGGLWSNTCCTHPRPGECPDEAAHRRLREEMGLDCVLEKLFCFTYRTKVSPLLTEYEYDHIFIGQTNTIPDINPTEVWDWRYLSSKLIQTDLRNHPEKYACWFSYLYDQMLQQNINLV